MSSTVRYPEGCVYLVGGNEEKHGERKVLAELVRRAGGGSARVCVLTTPSSIPHEVGSLYERILMDLGAGEVRVAHADSRDAAASAEAADLLRGATALLLTGGDLRRARSLLIGTPLGEAVRAFAGQGRVLAGTGAGASCLGAWTVGEGEGVQALRHEGLVLGPGLGVLEGAMVDPHFVERARFGRVIQAVAMRPGLLGLGIGEDTAAAVDPDGTLTVLGSGAVVVVDGSDLGRCEALGGPAGTPVTLEGVRLHVLGPGRRFDLGRRTLLG